MITMDESHDIKRAVMDGKSISAVAREYGHDRKTIRKILDKDLSQAPSPVPRQRAKKADASVREWLEGQLRTSSAMLSPKDRPTATRLHKLLEEGSVEGVSRCAVSRRTVCRYIAAIKQDIKAGKPHFIRLTHPAGQAQVDFGEMRLIWKRHQCALAVLVLTLPQSNARFACLLPAQNFECVAKGLTLIFKHMGGVPPTIRFDNMSTAVSKVHRPGDLLAPDIYDAEGHPRRIVDDFKRMMCHYGFRAEFCNTAAGNEKGSVENAVGWVRHNFFLPTIGIDTDLDAFNSTVLIPGCDKAMEETHYQLGKKIRELYQNDRDALLPLPAKLFDGATWCKATVNNYSEVQLEGNSYQVDCARGTQVFIKKTADHLMILDANNRQVGFWPRSYEQGSTLLDWDLHLKDLSRKPMAYRNSPLRKLMDEQCDSYLMHLRSPDRAALLAAIRQKTQKAALEDVLSGLSQVLKECCGKSAADVVCRLRGHGEATADQTPKMSVPKEWNVTVQVPSLSVYGVSGHA
jgi:transposase